MREIPCERKTKSVSGKGGKFVRGYRKDGKKVGGAGRKVYLLF